MKGALLGAFALDIKWNQQNWRKQSWKDRGKEKKGMRKKETVWEKWRECEGTNSLVERSWKASFYFVLPASSGAFFGWLFSLFSLKKRRRRCCCWLLPLYFSISFSISPRRLDRVNVRYNGGYRLLHVALSLSLVSSLLSKACLSVSSSTKEPLLGLRKDAGNASPFFLCFQKDILDLMAAFFFLLLSFIYFLPSFSSCHRRRWCQIIVG